MRTVYYNLNGFYTSCITPRLPYCNECLFEAEQISAIVRLTDGSNNIDLVSTTDNFYLVNATNIGSEELLYTVSRSDANLNYQVDAIAHLYSSQLPDDFRATIMLGTPAVEIVINEIPTDMDINYNWDGAGFIQVA